MNAVAVSDAALSAGPSPGILALRVVVAWAIVRGSPSTIVRNSSAKTRSVSVMVVGAGACADESTGTSDSLGRKAGPLLVTDSSQHWDVLDEVYALGPRGFVDSSLHASLLVSERSDFSVLLLFA